MRLIGNYWVYRSSQGQQPTTILQTIAAAVNNTQSGLFFSCHALPPRAADTRSGAGAAGGSLVDAGL